MRVVPALAVVGLVMLFGGCGLDPSPSVGSHDEAVDAIIASLSGPFAWEARLSVHVADEDLERMDERDREDVEWLEWLAANHVEGALAGDGSWRLAVAEDGEPWADLRLDARELLLADSPEPNVSLYLSADVPAVLERLYGIGDAESVAEVRDGVDRGLRGEERSWALALLDGTWSGVTGAVQLAELDLTEEDLAELRSWVRSLMPTAADGEPPRELLDDAVTLHSFEPADGGGTVAVLDVHPASAMTAVRSLLGDAGPWMWLYWLATDDLPDTVEAVGRVTFDRDARVTDVTIEVLDLLEAIEGDGWNDRPSPETSFAVTLTFSQHGEVATVMDVPDPATISWSDLLATLSRVFDVMDEVAWERHEPVEIVGPPPVEEPGETEEPGSSALPQASAPPGDEEALAVARQVVRAAAALEIYRHQHGAYDAGGLTSRYGFEDVPDVVVNIAVLTDDYYCLEGVHDQRDEQPMTVMETDGPARYADGQLTCELLADDRTER